MKRAIGVLAVLATCAVVGISVSVAAAADLANAEGQSCGTAVGTWHFVNNQTGGAGPGTLTAVFSSGTVGPVGPIAVNQNTQHFIVTATGTLISASTTLPGRLVLSDFTCAPDDHEPPPPPPPPPPDDHH